MSATRPTRFTGTRGYAQLNEVAVPVARVWRSLTDAALIRIWSGAAAEVDARKGGVYRIELPGIGKREAHIDVFDSNRRLRLIYMTNPAAPPCASAIVDDFLLDVRPGETLTSLRLLGSGIPEAPVWDPHYARIRLGWERSMARIKVTLENPPRPKEPPPTPPKKDPPLPGLDY
jgi:uncharacterized protein YndB with AHSA1/START domain